MKRPDDLNYARDIYEHIDHMPDEFLLSLYATQKRFLTNQLLRYIYFSKLNEKEVTDFVCEEVFKIKMFWEGPLVLIRYSTNKNKSQRKILEEFQQKRTQTDFELANCIERRLTHSRFKESRSSYKRKVRNKVQVLNRILRPYYKISRREDIFTLRYINSHR